MLGLKSIPSAVHLLIWCSCSEAHVSGFSTLNHHPSLALPSIPPMAPIGHTIQKKKSHSSSGRWSPI